MITWLTDPEVLRSQAGLSLAQRAVIFHRKFPETKISAVWIGKIYKRNKIRRKIVSIKKFSNLRKKMKIENQIKVAKTKLIELV